MNNNITKEDVYTVAKSVHMQIDDSVAKEVISRYEEESKNDPTATWELIIENILYNILMNGI